MISEVEFHMDILDLDGFRRSLFVSSLLLNVTFFRSEECHS